jgi:hypothetical protein
MSPLRKLFKGFVFTLEWNPPAAPDLAEAESLSPNDRAKRDAGISPDAPGGWSDCWDCGRAYRLGDPDRVAVDRLLWADESTRPLWERAYRPRGCDACNLRYLTGMTSRAARAVDQALKTWGEKNPTERIDLENSDNNDNNDNEGE